jgi:hypothetical protein
MPAPKYQPGSAAHANGVVMVTKLNNINTEINRQIFIMHSLLWGS